MEICEFFSMLGVKFSISGDFSKFYLCIYNFVSNFLKNALALLKIWQNFRIFANYLIIFFVVVAFFNCTFNFSKNLIIYEKFWFCKNLFRKFFKFFKNNLKILRSSFNFALNIYAFLSIFSQFYCNTSWNEAFIVLCQHFY